MCTIPNLFNSLSVLSVFSKEYKPNSKEQKRKIETKEVDDVNIILNHDKKQPGIKFENGITILEALSASGLRSIRYAKEIPGIKKIIANDLSKKAVESIKANIESNSVEHMVETSHSDAM